MAWPRRRAVAIRSHRQRTPGEVGRNLRSNSLWRRATVPTMLSSRISWMPMSRSLRRPSAATTSSNGSIIDTSSGSNRMRDAIFE